MLRPRIIPCLLVQGKGLVKTRGFADPKYVGDPINAVKVFNEKQVDELIVLDIEASARGTGPDYTLIRNLAAECRMPLCYGGGIQSLEQAERVIAQGVEKVAISTSAIRDPALVGTLANVIGRQSVVVVLDVRRSGAGYRVFADRGTRDTGLDAVAFAAECARLGAGEIVINSVDNDGLMSGYDLEMVSAVKKGLNVPVTVLGGAGSLKDMAALFGRVGVVGAAAGSLFVFKGAYRAVLISYPAPADKEQIFRESIQG
ncbi:MAG: imidazole glycerol phosphate synthase subunit HisF [Gammaproteobacteria bacterium]|nr:imidazole glycerol phosphate synthase subunit HisF [Gammaproteobacteria bacterium]